MKNHLKKYVQDGKELNTGIFRLWRSDAEIVEDFSTRKFKINKAFLNWIHKYNYLWEDYSLVNNYLITPLKNDYVRLEYNSKPTSEHGALFVNATQSMFIDNAYRMANGLNIIKTCYGDTGSGKSRTSINDAFLVHDFVSEVLGKDVTFTDKNICFSRQEHMELIPNLKQYESGILDEDNEAILGVGSFSSKSFIDRYEKTLRSLSKNFWNNSPNLTPHNEHWIMKSVGINDHHQTNKAIIRERDNLFYSSVIFPNYKGRVFNKFLIQYEKKKRKFQKTLEQRTGDDKRIERVLEMAVKTIIKWSLTFDFKARFKSFVSADYKLSIADATEVANFMTILLDNRLEMFPKYKDQVKEFIN